MAMGTVTCVALRKQRFSVIDLVRVPIKSGKHQREVLGIVARDKRTNRKMFFGSMHVDPLGKGFVEANPMARARHIHQVWEWARWTQRFLQQSGDNAAFIGGDVNERMNLEHQVAEKKPALRHRTTIAQFREVGLQPAAEARQQRNKVKMLDIFGGGRKVKCTQRLQFTIPDGVEGAEFLDHELVYTQWALKKVES